MKKWFYILIVFSAVNCRDPYTVIIPTNGDGVLVVEGIVNGAGKTTITLSRTTRLSDKRIAPERSAVLTIESENNSGVFPLFETTEGNYESADLALDASTKYRLRIQTSDGREYATDFKNYIVTPAIDSISWRQTSEGVDVFTNSHDETGQLEFFKLDYHETWEFHSAYRTLLGFMEVDPSQNDGYKYRLKFLDPVTQSVDTTLFVCYNERPSNGINIVSTERLAENVVLAPVRSFPTSSIELSVLYSILVKQYAISKEAFEFYDRVKKNTEQLGSIFDAQPSEVSGNVVCLSNPSEIVIGYVEFTTVESMRTFIDNRNLTDWGYKLENCDNYFGNPILNDPSLFEELIKQGLFPTTIHEEFPGGGIKSFNVQKEDCVDCRRKGSNIKPDFWP
ncbi:MAG: DUF4249 domain-containing protein [Chitinophagaceae bacterium]|nr:DUF4249 domain-containing protein [Chitinophagaceae bacterium]